MDYRIVICGKCGEKYEQPFLLTHPYDACNRCLVNIFRIIKINEIIKEDENEKKLPE